MIKGEKAVASGVKCPKCGYVRRSNDRAPAQECPSCGIIYSKFDPSARLNSPNQPPFAPGGGDRPSIRNAGNTHLPVVPLLMAIVLLAGAGFYFLMARGEPIDEAHKLPYDITGAWIGRFEDTVEGQGTFTCVFEVEIDEKNRVAGLYWTEFKNNFRQIEGYWERPDIVELSFAQSDTYAGEIRSTWGRNAADLYFEYDSDKMGAFNICADQVLYKDQREKLAQPGEFVFKKDEEVLEATVDAVLLEKGTFLLSPGALKSLKMPRMEVAREIAGMDKLPSNVKSNFTITSDVLGINDYPHRLYNQLRFDFSALNARVRFDPRDAVPDLLSFNENAVVSIRSDGFSRTIQIHFHKNGRKTATVNQKSAGGTYPLRFDLEKKED